MTEAAAHTNPFVDRIAELARALGERGPAWLREARRADLARFEALGFPSTREEAWKNTNVAPIAATPFVPADAERLAADALPTVARLETGGPRLVFVDGRWSRRLSAIDELPDGLWLGSLADAIEQHPETVRELWERRRVEATAAFCALNGALVEDGAVVRVGDGVTLDRPIQLIFVSTVGKVPTASHPRTLLRVGRSSQLTLIESHVGATDGVYWTNAVTDVAVGPDSVVEHYRVQSESEQAYHVSTLEVRQAAHSRYRSFQLDLGGRLVRHDQLGVLDGAGSNSSLDGLYLTRGRQHLDHHTILDHAKPHCDSRELYKGILAGRSRTVFNGRIVVRREAQKTDAKQSNPNLLLSEAALAHTRPQLEIYADDVKCTHGATVGRLDEDAVFYLRSRGLADDAARRMLVEAFAGELLERIRVEPLRAFAERELGARLEGCIGEEKPCSTVS